MLSTTTADLYGGTPTRDTLGMCVNTAQGRAAEHTRELPRGCPSPFLPLCDVRSLT